MPEEPDSDAERPVQPLASSAEADVSPGAGIIAENSGAQRLPRVALCTVPSRPSRAKPPLA